MSDNKNHIDKLFKEKLGERSFEVPVAFLADLENKLDAPIVASKRIRGFWFWLSSIVAAGLATAGYFILKETETTPQLYSAVKTENKITTPKFATSEALFVKVKNADDKETFVAASTFKKAAKAFQQDNQKKLSAMKKEVEANYKRVEDSIKLANQSNLMASSGPRNSSPDPTNSGDRTLDNREEQLLVYLGANNIVRKFLTQDPQFGAFNGQRRQFLTDATNLSFVDDTLRRIRYVIIDSVVIRDSLVIRDSIIYIDSSLQNPTKTTKLKDEGKKSRFEIQAFGGFMMVRPKIESPFDTYPELLKSKETALTTPNFGFALNVYLRDLCIGSGAEYYHWGDKSAFTETQTSNEMTFDINTFYQYILDSNGQVIDSIPFTQIDTNIITVASTKNYNVTNTYSQFSIPLKFGYVFGKNKWKFIPRVGLNFEFAMARRTGIYVDQNGNNPFEVTERNFGMSYVISTELRRDFGNWHVFVCPYFRNNINFLIESPEMNRKYGGFGTTFGIGVRL
jgi:hypothetical protein